MKRFKKISMSNRLLKLFAITILVLGLGSGLALAGGNNTKSGVKAATEGEQTSLQGVLEFPVTVMNLNGIISFDCVASSGPICVSVADCCIVGDVWVGTISGTDASDPDRTSNQTRAGVAFVPERFSARRCTSSPHAIIHASAGNLVPGSLPAGFTVRITSGNGSLSCVHDFDGSF